jgi:hypothetical protein
MTTPLDLTDATVTEAPDFGVPDHTASAGISDRIREGVTGRRRLSQPREPKAERKPRVRSIEPPSRPGEFVEPLENLYGTVATLLMPFDPLCASVVLEEDEKGSTRARKCAEALDEAAQKSDGLRRILRMVTTGGTWGKVIAVHAPILMAVLSHHTPLMSNLADFQAKRMEQMMNRDKED